jgi:ATP-dependent helicase HepA
MQYSIRPSLFGGNKRTMAFPTGCFVESQSNALGIGKLLEADADRATVEYFESPATRERFRCIVPLRSLTPVCLEPEVRVYFEDRESLTWHVGRVLHYQESDKQYLVRFPNDARSLIHESHLVTRWRKPIDDPTDHLALQLNETPFWHHGRSAFIHSVYCQRHACGGMPGLLSSSIDLVEHQIAVVRRVLQDPFQRYLLADEVGLGKTIEAGILIRQYVLDEYESHRVLVIVPNSLIQQWKSELTQRFHLEDQLGSSIHVIGNRDYEAIVRLGATANMIVVDEAHHIAAWALSENPESAGLFRAVAKVSESPERRVLLLSATPVLHNEAAFLAMLHLIDPVVHSLDDLDAFRQRVRHRQEVAESLVSLTEDESNFFLAQTLTDLGTFFPDDTRFHELREALSVLVEQDVAENDSERCRLIRTLRAHISETWRLHRRLLRNRRSESTECLLPGRGGSEKCLWETPGVATLSELLNEWRLSAARALYNHDDSGNVEATRHLARLLAEAESCDPHCLSAIASARLKLDGKTREGVGLFDSDKMSIRAVPRFEGECELLKQICHAAEHFDDLPRFRCLESLIKRLDSSNDYRAAAIVVFANYAETADRVCDFLRQKFGANRVLRHEPANTGWTRFLESSQGLILVCDRRAEEGLNLRNRRSVAIHFDLPLSANRIEQRMGRLDRFGTGRRIPSFALVASQSATQSEWYRCLDEAFQVFHRSIASLQYVIDAQFQRVWSEFLDAGADALSDAISRLAGKEGAIETEFRHIRAQDALDAFERDPTTEKEFVEKLETFDLKASRFQEDLEQWLVHRLHFRASGEEGRSDDVVRYQVCRRDDLRPRRGEKDTLMPYRAALKYFKAALDDPSDLRLPVVAQTKPLAFDRQTSQRRETRLARIGDSLIDAVERYTRWDDRGICFAMWRYRPCTRVEEVAQVYLRFDIIAEANQSPLCQLLDDWPEASLTALRRRADMAFPPIVGQLWLDSELERVTAPDQLAILNEPYRDDPVGGKPHLGRDINLSSDRWPKVNEVYDITVWRELCYAAREKAIVVLREQSKMPDAIRVSVAKAKAHATERIEQFESRLARINGDGAITIHRELKFEHAFATALQTAICHASVRVDSMGAVFLSATNPFGDEPPREDNE